MKAAVYLSFNLNAQDVIDAYTAIFGAKVELLYPYEEGMTDDPALFGKVFHSELKIGDLNLYLADSGKEPVFSSIGLVAEISDAAEAHRVFDQLAEGGEILSPFEQLPVGPMIALVRDRFGVKWNIVIA